uniref:Uncharacterized protein n=1 Tax=viral metagenome TaxID=1070528 RepID=A0A6M3K424_9ZZZZ
MRIAILYENDEIYVEFDPEKFRLLFKQYLRKYKTIDAAFNMIIKDLKKAALTK